MFKIALCGCPNSKHIITSKIASFFGNSVADYSISEFINTNDLTNGVAYDLYFLNLNLFNNADILLQYVKKEIEREDTTSNKRYGLLAYVNDPVSDSDCEMVIDCLMKYLEHDSMYFTVEFLTDKGLRSIAISKILFFEFLDRKIKIKTHNNEYFCKDTLRNLMSLVGNFDFYQPHKSFIVNLKHIVSIKNYTVTMNDGSLIPLSQKKSNDFRKAYKKLYEQHNAKVLRIPRGINSISYS